MSEEEKVEVVETPEAAAAAWDSVMKETTKVFESLGKAIGATVQNASNLMLIEINQDTREQLDVLVQSGVAENRQEAIKLLIAEGLKSRDVIFERIRQTNEQIAALRQQIRTLVTG